MRIGDLFETRVEDKIDPVIKVAETADEQKLAGEIGGYVVTPLIERCLSEYLEHYTDTTQTDTTEIGVWISGYFGSGKSHLAKVMALLAENRKLAGSTACERFKARIPAGSPSHNAIERDLSRIPQCQARVLASNLNTLTDSRNRPLPSLLLSQYYLSRGYGGNLLYARVIEAQFDEMGKLADLHGLVEAKTKKPWSQIQQNPGFYRKPLYEAACELAPSLFSAPADVEKALREAESGEIHNVRFLVDTLLSDLDATRKATKKPQRYLLVLDESGQWIENDSGRLAQLQALIEEAAVRGQGRIWIIVTTHGDMGSILKEARALDGDMRKIEARFRFKFALTAENIGLVLRERLLRKKVAARQELGKAYGTRSGVLRDIGCLVDTVRNLPECTEDRFADYYPFFPYQIHLVPEIVKSLRSKGGRGEQLSGSTRTLLAITQDILRAGRRRYLDEGVGAVVSFDEIYGNLSAEGEVSPDVRADLLGVEKNVTGATALTSRVAEILYLIRELDYIPRTRENLARLLVENMDDDLPTVIARVEPELDRLIKAKMVARIGETFEFLTGERRTFEDEVGALEAQNYSLHQDRERGLMDHFVYGDGKAHWRRWLDFDTVPHMGTEFAFRLMVDDASVQRTEGHVGLMFHSPLAAQGSLRLDDLESRSMRADEQQTIFFLCGRVKGFDRDLSRYLAMRDVVDGWKGDPHRSEDAKKLALDRESTDLPKLEREVLQGFREGIRTGFVVFRGASHAMSVRDGQKPSDALRAELAAYWPVIYPKFDKVPVRVTNDQRAIQDVLEGTLIQNADVKQLKIYDRGGKLDPNCPLLDAIRIHLSTEQAQGRRVLGRPLLDTFNAPPYGWDRNAVRVGVAALVRAGSVRVLIDKKPYTNPADRDLVDALRGSRAFDRVELVLEDTSVDPDVLTETRAFIMKLAKKRGIDETPAAISEALGQCAASILGQVSTVETWSSGAGFPLPTGFTDGKDAWTKIQELTNPVHRVKEAHGARDALQAGADSIAQCHTFQEKHAVQFVDLTRTVNECRSVRHAVLTDGAIMQFIDGCQAARDAAKFADDGTWKQVQGLKEQALLEQRELVERWQNDARATLDDALAGLPSELAKRSLPAGLAEELGNPLRDMLATLDGVTAPSAAAVLPAQAEEAVRQLGVRIRAEQQKANPPPTPPTPGPTGGKPPAPTPTPPKPPVQRLRMSQVSPVTRVASEAEWNELREALDARVKDLLAKGFEVDLG